MADLEVVQRNGESVVALHEDVIIGSAAYAGGAFGQWKPDAGKMGPNETDNQNFTRGFAIEHSDIVATLL